MPPVGFEPTISAGERPVHPHAFRAIVLYVFLTLLYWPNRKVTIFLCTSLLKTQASTYLPLEYWQSAKHRVCICLAIHRQWNFQNKVHCSVNVVVALYEVLVLSLPLFKFCRLKFLSFQVESSEELTLVSFFCIFRTVLLRIILVGNQLDTQFLLWYVYLNPLHVSSNYVLILRKTIVLTL